MTPGTLSPALLLLVATATLAGTGGNALAPSEQAKLVEVVRPALVRVEYTLRFDNDEEPDSAGWVEWCPNCGRVHTNTWGESLIKAKRPREVGGFLLSPTLVLTQDPVMYPRFIERIAVRFGEQVIDARVSALLVDQPGMILELATPAPERRPLSFDATAAGPYYTITYQLLNAAWTTQVVPLAAGVTLTEDGRRFQTAPHQCIVVDRHGTAIGTVVGGVLPLDGSWKGSPLERPAYTADQVAAMLDRLKGVVTSGLLPVNLTFRSPRDMGESSLLFFDGDAEDATERDVVAVVLDHTTLLVLASLEPQVTALLDKLRVRLPSGEQVEATYGRALREYGCFTAHLDAPLSAALTTRDTPITDLRDNLLLAADYRFFGKTPIVRYLHARVASFRLGYERLVYPDVREDEDHRFLFDSDGVLVALPMERRALFTSEDDYWSGDSPDLTPIAYINEHLRNLDKYADENNTPQPEEREERIAWLGVEMQELDPELAVVNNVSDITMDGETGAIVAFVYPGSPAAEAGMQLGDILLRLYVPGHYRPIPVSVSDDLGMHMSFGLDVLAEIPEEFLSKLPPPWPPVENQLSKTLTDIGFGKPFELEYHRAGQTHRIPLTVVESPRHYASAPRFKSEPLGLTVRELTYEVRRFFHLQPDDPGLVISRIEPGSKASVAGLRPYEMITRVNDKPVTTVQAFKSMMASSNGELRLTVKQMDRTRIVKLATSAG